MFNKEKGLEYLIEEKDIVILNNDEDNEHRFVVIGNDECYILLKIIKDGDREALTTIEDDEEYNKVSTAAETLYKDEVYDI